MVFRVITDGSNTYLTLKNEYGDIEESQTAIFARSGYGKGLLSEAIAETFHEAGYLILVLADPKGEIEYGFQMFEPEATYHLNELKKQGYLPERKPVKLYHPFTFNIPKNKKLPEITFFTLSLKDMGRREWSMISESTYDSDAIKLLLHGSDSITNSEGIYA